MIKQAKQRTRVTYTIKLRVPSRSPQVDLDLCKAPQDRFRLNLTAPSQPPEDAATRGRRTNVFQRTLAAFPTHVVPSQVPNALHHTQRSSKVRISRNQPGLTVAPRATVLATMILHHPTHMLKITTASSQEISIANIRHLMPTRCKKATPAILPPSSAKIVKLLLHVSIISQRKTQALYFPRPRGILVPTALFQ